MEKHRATQKEAVSLKVLTGPKLGGFDHKAKIDVLIHPASKFIHLEVLGLPEVNVPNLCN